jgi:hypothetical protein
MKIYKVKVFDGAFSITRDVSADEVSFSEHSMFFKLVTGTLVAVYPTRMTAILEIEDLDLRNLKNKIKEIKKNLE